MNWTWPSGRGEIAFTTPPPEAALPEVVRAKCNPVASLPRIEKAILSALRLWPRGATAAALAGALGVHRSTAARGLRRAHENGYVIRSDESPPCYRSYRRAVFWRLADAEHTAVLMPYLPIPSHIVSREFSDLGVPPQFWHLFWSGTDPSCLRLPRDATLVGCRLMESFDSEARSWVLSRFPSEQLEECLSTYPDPDSEVPTLIRRSLEALW